MRPLLAFAVLAITVISGCGHGANATHAGEAGQTQEKEKPVDPMEATRAGMHEGAFQLGNAADDLEAVIAKAKALQASTKDVDLKAALADVLEKLDDAGGAIADFTGEPPDLAQFKNEFDEQDKKRLDSIDNANDALHDIHDCDDTLDDFYTKPPPGDDQALNDLGDALDDAAADLEDAIKAFGGKVEPDDTETIAVPDTTPTDQKQAPLPDL
jgi:hypothetical protein